MTEKNSGRIPDPEELGIPSGNLDPMKALKGELKFYDKVAQPRSPITKMFSVMFIMITFIIPPIFIVNYMIFADPPENIDVIYIFTIILLALYFLAGIRTTYNILSSKK